jgi:hypothetical protein
MPEVLKVFEVSFGLELSEEEEICLIHVRT